MCSSGMCIARHGFVVHSAVELSSFTNRLRDLAIDRVLTVRLKTSGW